MTKSSIHFSAAAESDLRGISEYTLRTWGPAQADRYLAALEDCFSRLAFRPLLGRACDHVRTGLRRMEEGQHVIFYRPYSGGILVSRVLHRSMLPEAHPMQED
jgi:toxin ParE1/3/4